MSDRSNKEAKELIDERQLSNRGCGLRYALSMALEQRITMIEQFRSGPGATGYPIDPSEVDLDIYRLLLPFAASRALHKASTGQENDPINLLRQQFEESEASRALLNVAIILRNAMDERGESILGSESSRVGTLVKDTNRPKTKEPLSFRESCHKIIHALQINFDAGGEGQGKLPYLRPIVHLYGKKRDKKHVLEWKATFNIFAFARRASRYMVG